MQSNHEVDVLLSFQGSLIFGGTIVVASKEGPIEGLPMDNLR